VSETALGFRSARQQRRHRTRSAVSLAVAVLALVLIGGGGSLLPVQSAPFHPSRIALVGRTSTLCTEGVAEKGSSTSISAVVIRQAPDRTGTLTATPIGQSSPTLALTQQGIGRLLTSATTVDLQGQGVMATASSGQVFTTGRSGVQAGLMSAPCLPPGTEHWFVGVGAESSERSELILTNPDDSEAEVDLQFFGPQGLITVPGSPGVVVAAHAARTISLETLIASAGPLTVSVKATTGRVAAVARDIRSVSLAPDGADWHTSATSPSQDLVIPDLPEGDGTRELVVANPTTSRAQVTVRVLGLLGGFAPAGAETLAVPPESTASVDLATGLAGGAGGVQLVSDQPVTGSVISSSKRSGTQSDFAVQSATPSLVRTGVVALATASGADSQLVLSNGADVPSTVSFQVFSYDGVQLQSDAVLIGGQSTSTRRLDVQAPSFLVVNVADHSSIHGGVVFEQPEGPVAGLTSVTLVSPDVASRAPDVVTDPSVGR
jgi:hypothetical protein